MQSAAEFLAHVRKVVQRDLPAHRRWHVWGSTLDLDFEISNIRTFSPSDMVGQPDPQWLQLVIFGVTDFAEGGGAATYLTIEPSAGRIFDLDVEASDSLTPLNSSLDKFVQTFSLVDRFLSANLPVPAEIRAAAASIDPLIFPHSKQWEGLLAGAGNHG